MTAPEIAGLLTAGGAFVGSLSWIVRGKVEARKPTNGYLKKADFDAGIDKLIKAVRDERKEMESDFRDKLTPMYAELREIRRDLPR